MGGQNIQEVRELEDRLPGAGTPEGSLTAINSLPTMEAYRPLLSQNVLQAGLQHRSARGATSRTPTEHSSDEEADDRGHESSSSSRRETPTKIPVLNLPTPARRPKKRRDDRTDSDKDETSSKLNEIVGVMKDSANHLVARSQTLAHDHREQERVSFFQWMLEFTSRMPRQNWREFQKQAFNLACAYTPTDSPQGHPSRPRISQGSSTSS